jgi:hypothetical protein
MKPAKRFFKVRRTEDVGVFPKCDYIKYIGKSRLDGFPIFSIEYPSGDNPLYFIISNLIVNTKPGYALKSSEIEAIPSPEEQLRYSDEDLAPVQSMDQPSGTLFYMDHIYDSLDERLLLML